MRHSAQCEIREHPLTLEERRRVKKAWQKNLTLIESCTQVEVFALTKTSSVTYQRDDSSSLHVTNARVDLERNHLLQEKRRQILDDLERIKYAKSKNPEQQQRKEQRLKILKKCLEEVEALLQ